MAFKFLILIEKILNKIYTLLVRRSFKKFGNKSIIKFGSIINNPYNIEIGDNVFIDTHVWLNAGEEIREDKRATLIIKDGVYISRNTHINAFKDVIVEEDVLIGENVYFGDADHSTELSDVPIIKQKVEIKNPVKIKSGCHLCRNSIISAGVTVGKNSVIGPGAFVVDLNIDDNSMLLGNPAVVIEKFNIK